MKTTKILIMLVLALLLGASAFTGSAQAQSKTMPIDSVGSAVSHNILLIRELYGNLGANSLLYTNGSRTFWYQAYNPNGVPKLSDLVTMVRTNTFTFMLARPDMDSVSAYVSYDSADGDQLFYADENFWLIQSNGSWQMPVNAGTNIENNLGYYEPIYETNAVEARLNLRDSNGNLLQVIDLDVYPVGNTVNSHIGKIMNQTPYLGQHGELVVTYGQYDQNGYETNDYDVAFNLGEGGAGAAIVPANLTASFNPSWGGIVVPLSPPFVYLTNVPSFNHIGSSPLVQITVTNAMTVYFGASTTEGETANGFTVKLLQTGMDLPPVPYSINYGNTLGVPLPPGTYHIDFTWPQLAPEQIYPSWYYQKGGGSIGVVATPADSSGH